MPAAGTLDNDGADLNQTRAPQPLVFSDDSENEEIWRPGDSLPAVEAFWRYVAERTDAGIKGVSVEFPDVGDGIQAHFWLDLLARYRVLTPDDGTTDPEYHVEYALLDGMADYRALVRAALRTQEGLHLHLRGRQSEQHQVRQRDADLPGHGGAAAQGDPRDAEARPQGPADLLCGMVRSRIKRLLHR